MSYEPTFEEEMKYENERWWQWRERLTSKLPKECPKCDEVAETLEEGLEIFGIRWVKLKDGRRPSWQSRCTGDRS